MPSIFWTGKLSFPMKLMVNINNLFAWITGNARDITAMKDRMKKGYEGAITDHVTRYDHQGLEHYSKIAAELLKDIDIQGKEVLDVGCGTGILSHSTMERGPSKIVCGDNSEYMLNQCRKKASDKGVDSTRMEFRQFDAESLPFDDSSFDAVISGMMLGMVPNQKKAIREMARVLRSGGMLALSTHGPEHYWEANDAGFRSATMRYVFGYRVEFWPRKEIELQRMFEEVGLSEVRTRRLTWKDDFKTGGDAYDFYAATSSLWWLAKFPQNKVAGEWRKTRDYFDRKGVKQITQDVILAYAQKTPGLRS